MFRKISIVDIVYQYGHTNFKTFILDAGDYYTIAHDSRNAVYNVLDTKDFTMRNSMMKNSEATIYTADIMGYRYGLGILYL